MATTVSITTQEELKAKKKGYQEGYREGLKAANNVFVLCVVAFTLWKFIPHRYVYDGLITILQWIKLVPRHIIVAIKEIINFIIYIYNY